MKTRRKSRKEQEASSSQAADESVPQSPTMSVGPSHSFHIALPDELPLESLSALLPETSLEAPSPESILYIYKLLLAQANDLSGVSAELEELRSQLMRKDVELDQALQDKESAVAELEQSVEATRNELKSVVVQRDELRASQGALQSQLATMSSSQTSRSSELDVLRVRIEETEREKRDLVGVVDRLRSDGTQAEDEIRTLRENLKDARNEIEELQTQLRQIRSTDTTNKFKIESLENQLQIAKEDSAHNAKELDAKIEEFAKYRRDANAQRSALQSSYDALTHDYESCKSELESIKRSDQHLRDQLASALDKVNSLQDQLAEEGTASRAQAEVQARLIELLEKRNAEAKKRVEAVDNEWDRTVREHQDREERLKEQLQREKERVEQFQRQINDILKRSEDSSAQSDLTPEPSSSATIVAGFMKNTKLSDIFEENRKLKDELRVVKIENVRLVDTTAELISKVQEMAPQVSEQRFEYERQRQEAIQLSQQLSAVLSERDSAVQRGKEMEQKFAAVRKENGLLESQLKDLGRQVTSLLREISIMHDPSLANIPQEDSPPTDNTSEIDTMISNELVVFKHLPSFQEQYTRHLKIIRELGERLERVTREQYDEQARIENQALEDAADLIASLQQELETQKRTHEIEIRGFIQERDMCKARMGNQLQASSSRGVGFGGVDQNGNGYGHHHLGESEYESLLADLQRNFDIYRNETGVDMKKLREELQESQRATAQLEAALAKATAKLENYNERHAMLNDTYTRQKQELDNLRRRNEDLLNQVHRVESASHHISEQLATATSTVERLRHETATLKAEKEIWKTIERRLTEENQSLSKEKSQLSDVMSNINRMHRDLEQTVQNDKRRLETQVQLLESQTQDLKTQLAKEREQVRHVSLKRELDTKELQERIDKATEDLSKTRENLIAAETSRTYLQQRTDDLSKILEANLEKLSVYERRPSGLIGSASQNMEGRSREEQLEAEVAELRAAVKMAEVDLEMARVQMDQFKDLSQASEAAFEKINSAYEEYKTATETEMSRREADIQSLQERIRAAEVELATSSERIKELQNQFEEERKALIADKQTLEATIVDMSSSASHAQTDETERMNMMKMFEERVVAAEERYQRELISHAEAVKTVDGLKQQLAEAQTLAREKQTAADSAQSMLVTAEISWKSQKEALDKEIAEINKRSHDLQQQNAILHDHLESVSSQASRIRQVAESSADKPTESGDDSSSDLGPVVSWLRSEKEIVDLQLELNKQENLRLKSQVEHLSRSLEETRATLSEERERASGAIVSAAQHAELLERINQLNLLRESNATLRSECESHRKRSESLEMELNKLRAELLPVKEEERNLRAQLELKVNQLQRLERENQQWKERNQQILSKYDRIDPAEMQQLKEKLAQLEAEKGELAEAKEKIEAQEKELTKMNGYRDNLARFKSSYGDLLNQHRALKAEHEKLSTQLTEKTAQLGEVEQLKARLDTLAAEKTRIEEALARERAEWQKKLQDEANRLEGLLQAERAKATAAAAAVPVTTVGAEGQVADVQAAIDAAKRVWEDEKQQLTKARDEAAQREQAAAEESKKLAEANAQLEASQKKFQQRMTEQLKRQQQQQSNANVNVEQAVTARVAELTAQHEAALQATVAEATAKVRAELESQKGDQTGLKPEDAAAIATRHQEELAVLEKRLAEKHAQEVQDAVAAALAVVPKTEGPAQGSPDSEAVMQKLKEEHEAKLAEAVTQALERGRREINTKLMLKEGQLAKALAKVKDLESKLAGGAPQAVPSPTVSKPGPAAAATTTTPPTAAATATPSKQTTTPATLPKKPVAQGSPATTVVATPTPAPGRGGAARGRGRGVNIRGGAAAAAAQAAGRGAGILAQVNSAAAASPSGTSILGAAATTSGGAGTPNKRPREDGESSGSEAPSLAKRLRGGGPVTIQRNRQLPPAPES